VPFSSPTFVGSTDFQNFPVQRLLGARIFKIRPSNVCWGRGFSKFSCPTFVGSMDFQNFRIQRLLGARIFKIFLSNVCWMRGFSKFSYPTFVGARICAFCLPNDFWGKKSKLNYPSQQIRAVRNLTRMFRFGVCFMK